MKVIIIEDDVAIGFSLRLALEDRGHEVAIYADPTTVPYGSLQGDVILLDYYMPKMNGEEVLRELQKNQSLADLRVILMSASPHIEHVATAFKVRHLPKPFDLSVLYEYVEGGPGA